MDSIYHEQQEAALCAVHCLNSLLQGSYFSAVDLAELATNMDHEERRRMAEQGTDTTEYRNFIQSGSNNMDDSGMFSVQVVSAALQVWGLQLTPFTTAAPSFREDPTSGTAYICNMREHWFTIRRLGFQWFNLNSLLVFPELLSNTYLALFLAQLQNQGYCIYLVEGPLPPCTADTQIAAHPVTQAVKPLLLSEVADQEPQQDSGGDDSSSQEDADMAAAVAASLAEAGQGTAGEGRRLGGEEEESEEAQLERALQLSLTEQLAGVAGPSPNTSASERELEAAFTMLNLACGVLAQGVKVESQLPRDPAESFDQSESNEVFDQEMPDISQESRSGLPDDQHLVMLEQSGPALPSPKERFNFQTNLEMLHPMAMKLPDSALPSTKDCSNVQTNPKTIATLRSNVPEDADRSVSDVGPPGSSPTSPGAAAASEEEVWAANALVSMLHKRGEAAAPPTPPLPRRVVRARRQTKKRENKENEMPLQNESLKPVLCLAAGATASSTASTPDEATLRQRRLQFFDKKNAAAPHEDSS